MKWVATRPDVDPTTGEVSTDPRFSGFSPADTAALEWALQLGPSTGTPVVVLSVAPEAAGNGLAEMSAHGVEEVVRIQPQDDSGSSMDPAGLSSGQVASLLAEAALDYNPSLVLCGDYSLDRGSGSVPAYLAHELGWAQALGLISITPHQNSLRVERRLDQGRREILSVTGPTVLSMEQGPELRRASLTSLLGSPRSITVLERQVLDEPTSLVVTGTGPYVPRPRVIESPQGETRDRVRDLVGLNQTPKTSLRVHMHAEDAAELILGELRSWGYLDD